MTWRGPRQPRSLSAEDWVYTRGRHQYTRWRRGYARWVKTRLVRWLRRRGRQDTRKAALYDDR